MLDEAFSKSDPQSAQQALQAFRKFGFQLVIVTTVQNATTIEPYIDSVVMVSKTRTISEFTSLDNASTHKTPAVQRWLTAHPRFVVHFTPTSASWLNMVERWFAELTTQETAPRHPHLGASTQRRHPRVDRHLERQSPPPGVDQDPRPNPGQHRQLLEPN